MILALFFLAVCGLAAPVAAQETALAAAVEALYAAEDGDIVAQQKALEAILPLADAGDAQAQFVLGETYRLGFKAIEADIIKSWYWIQRSAAGGDAQGMLRAAQVFGREDATPAELVQAYIYATAASQQLASFPDADEAATLLSDLINRSAARLSEAELQQANERLAQGRVAP